MPFVPPKSLSKKNESSAPVSNQDYRGWPLAKITFGISKKKQDDLNTNVISHSFANLSLSSSSTSKTMNTTTNTNTNSIKNTNINEKKSEPQFISKNKSNYQSDRDSAIQQVKDILSTSPLLSSSPRQLSSYPRQLSASPRRKSAPESLSFTRKPSLPYIKVDLITPISSDVPFTPRKKNGELVKSSLKKGKSEPTTPTFPKYVHFNTDLEQIKLFKEAQKPQAVSAEVSSDESDDDDDFELSMSDLDSDNEDDNKDDNKDDELTITVPNMPLITIAHRSKPVFVESIFLSSDKRKLLGRIQVQNIAFQKSVEIRYTFDFWQTVSEVSANYAEGVPDKDNKNNFDLFKFAIELIDNSRNQIDVTFKRKSISSSSQSNKSNKPKPPPSTSSKWSTPSNNHTRKFEADSPPVRSPPMLNSSSTSITIKKSMGGRYDIGLSLIAAQSVTTSIGPNTINTNRTLQQSYYNNESFSSYFPGNCIDGMPITREPTEKTSWEKNSPSGIGLGFESLNSASNPIAIPSARPAIGSSSYCELVKQYCFYSGSPPVMT
ncbi:Carbohydrate-Binding Module Family 21 protein [Gigaspora rosea]|uniref:Carbohydrate-Binding Module Family 21 protein n=1 Tax=Gigaspora rosea TaxID=44941 RepID=A0A397TZC7_9GLOM|nr:Carbohydrate-Binding Module Family 21 protein [Gigaspora rosea]